MMKSDKPLVVFLGPAHPYRGGIASFTNRLAHEFNQQGWQSLVYTFSLQYPNFLFPGKTQYATEQETYGLEIHQAVNSINPFNWLKVGQELKELAPDLIIVRYWLPFMAPAFGTILRRAKSNGKTKVICIADNIIPHEKRLGDTMLTNYFQQSVDGFIAMSDQVMNDINRLKIIQPKVLLPHPLFDHFGEKKNQLEAKQALGLTETENVLLFFGFIRHYKGLDLLLRAMADERIQALQVKLIIAGEFYEDENKYRSLVDELQLNDCIIFLNEFIPDEKVALLMSAADALVQPYRHATQSGVTPLAMHFDLPMIVTNAGGLKEMVEDKVTGIVVEKSPESIASGIVEYFKMGKAYFEPGVIAQKKKYGWTAMMKGISTFAKTIVKAK
jgi:glycosyltransferase involved in cell wall biosynthesis